MSKRGNVEHPPIAEKDTRVMLLAWSYLDAVESKTGEGVGCSRLESSIPSRNGLLWPYGSYRDFERALDLLRITDRLLASIFERLHIYPAKWMQHPRDRSVKAVTELMPTNVYVPLSISYAAGYLSSEATAFAPMWDPDVKDEKHRAAAA